MTKQPHDSVKRIMIVDTHPLVREGLRNSFVNCGGFEVVAEAGDSTAALFAGQRHPHDILLIGAFLPGSNVFETIVRHKQEFPNTKVVICYAPDDPAFLQEFVERGADALVGQDAKSSEYVAAALSTIANGFYMSRNLVRCLLFDRKTAQQRINAYNLTRRETEVLRLLARGLCNKEVANMLQLSVRTVEAHRFNIRSKTGTNTLSDLVRIAQGIGIMPVNSPGTPNLSEPDIDEQAVENYDEFRVVSGGRSL